jgi:uncharacterized protein (DUF111 family)
MTEAITTGVFGTLILAAIIYLGARVDRLEDRLGGRIDHLAERIENLTSRVSHIEGRLDERETH